LKKSLLTKQKKGQLILSIILFFIFYFSANYVNMRAPYSPPDLDAGDPNKNTALISCTAAVRSAVYFRTKKQRYSEWQQPVFIEK